MKKRKSYLGVIVHTHHLKYSEEAPPSKRSEPTTLSLGDGVTRFFGIGALFSDVPSTFLDETSDDLQIVAVQGEDGGCDA